MITKKFLTNLSYAFGAQFISLALSMILSLLVPKLLGVTSFGYWQLFIFYTSYIPFFHFGLNDGVYLLNGGKSYDELDKSSLKSQLLLGTLMELLISLFICFFVFYSEIGLDRKFVIYQTLINFLLFCSSNYLGYIFQAVNETKIFSISIIINKVVFIILLATMLFLNYKSYKWMIIGYNFSQMISLIYCIVKSKVIMSSRVLNIKKTFKEIILTISVGSKLMLANIASMLILGVARFLIDKEWGIEQFAKISFSITLTNFFLLFINQVSMVLFPALRKITKKNQMKYYLIFDIALSISLPALFLFYFPLKVILSNWLPEYISSIYYFGFLLPLCNSNGKMQLLNNTYLKVLRMEKDLLKINLFTVILSLFFSVVSVIYFKSMYAVLAGLVLATWVRNFISEVRLKKFFGFKLVGYLQEMVLIIMYIYVISKFDSLQGFFIYLIVYCLYLAINKDQIIFILNKFKIMKERGFDES
jgi:O-antigen/teichoic acid export membrane protein